MNSGGVRITAEAPVQTDGGRCDTGTDITLESAAFAAADGRNDDGGVCEPENRCI